MKAIRAASLIRAVFAVPVLCVVLLVSCSDSPQALVASAKNYMSKGDYKAAAIQLKNALQQTPNDAEARYLLGTALERSRDLIDAESELRKAMALGYPPERTVPVLARLLIEEGQATKLVAEFSNTSINNDDARAELKTTLGNALLSLGKAKEAEAAFTAALAAKPGHPQAQLGLIALQARQGDIDGAAKKVDEVLATSPQLSEALLLKAEFQLAANQIDTAQSTLDKLIESSPDYLRARYVLLSILISKRDFEHATAQIQAIRNVSRFDVPSYYFEALIADMQGNTANARQAILQVLRVAPDHVPSLMLAGEIEFRGNQLPLAQDYLRKALQIEPNAIYARRLLAATFLRSGNPARALEVLQPALDHDSNDRQLLAMAAEAHLANNDRENAIRYYQQLASLNRNDVAARTRLAQIRFAAGDTERAMHELEAASALDADNTSADLALITSYMQRKELDKALAAVTVLEKKRPDKPLVHNIRGLIYLAKRDSASARTSFEKAVEIQPNYLPAIRALAELDVVEKNPGNARKRYDDILQKEPNNDQAILELANLMQRTGADSKEIESLLKKAVATNPKSTRARGALVKHYLERRDTAQALQAAESASKDLPNDPRDLEMLGVVQEAANEPGRAVETFGKLVTLQPGEVKPLLRLAGALISAKDYDKAIDTLRKALAINPNLIEANREIVGIYLTTGRNELALQETKAIQRQHPNEMLGYHLEGDFWAGQQKWVDAVTAYRAAQKRAPANGLVAIKQHMSLVGAGQNSEADAEIEKWLREHPKDVTVQSYLGERDAKRQDFKSALRHFQAAAEQQPNNPVLLNNLAWTAGQMNDPKALTYAEKAFSITPGNPEILDTLGALLVKKGDIANGLEKLQKAAQLAANRLDIRLRMAKAQIEAGNKDAARKELEAIIRVSSEGAISAPAGDKNRENQTSVAGVREGMAPQLTCRKACADEAAALLKTL